MVVSPVSMQKCINKDCLNIRYGKTRFCIKCIRKWHSDHGKEEFYKSGGKPKKGRLVNQNEKLVFSDKTKWSRGPKRRGL